MHNVLCKNKFFFLPLTIHCAQGNPPKIGTELGKVWNVVCYLMHKTFQLNLSKLSKKGLIKNRNTHLTFVLLFSSVIDLINDTNKFFKLRNNKFLSESLGQEDNVCAYTSDTETQTPELLVELSHHSVQVKKFIEIQWL